MTSGVSPGWASASAASAVFVALTARRARCAVSVYGFPATPSTNGFATRPGVAVSFTLRAACRTVSPPTSMPPAVTPAAMRSAGAGVAAVAGVARTAARAGRSRSERARIGSR